MDKYQKGALVQLLVQVRDAVNRRDCSVKFFHKLGYNGSELPTVPQLDALLIKVVVEKFGETVRADMLLMSFGLLQGYEYELYSITDRRTKFLRESPYLQQNKKSKIKDYDKANPEQREKAQDSLRNTERNWYKSLVEHLAEQDNIIQYVNDLSVYIEDASTGASATRKAKLPVPSYLSLSQIIHNDIRVNDFLPSEGNFEEPPPTQPTLVQPLEATSTEDEDSTSQAAAEPNSNGSPDAPPVENIVDSYNVIDDHSVTTMQHITNPTVIININSSTTTQTEASEPSELILVPDELPTDIQLLPSGDTEPEPPANGSEPELLPEEPVTFRKWVRAFIRSVVGVYSELPDDDHKALWTKLPAKTRWITITAISALIAVVIIVGTWFVWVKFNPSLDAAGPEQQENSVNLTKESNKITDEDMATLIADASASIAIFDEAGEYDFERMRELIKIRILTNPIFGDAVARGLLGLIGAKNTSEANNNSWLDEFVTTTDMAMEQPVHYKEGMRRWLIKASGLISTTDDYKNYADLLCRLLDQFSSNEVADFRVTNYWHIESNTDGIYTRAVEVSENKICPALLMTSKNKGGTLVFIFGFAIDDGGFCLSDPHRWGVDSYTE